MGENRSPTLGAKRCNVRDNRRKLASLFARSATHLEQRFLPGRRQALRDGATVRDREAHKHRNLIERRVSALKQFRRIATRYEKTTRAFVSKLCIGAARLRIKTVNTA